MKLTLLLLLPCTALAVAPPDVKYTAPADGAVDVDPHRKSITIIFDQEMNRKTGYSVIGGGDAFPQLDGDPGWKNATTFTIPVKLRPGHTYTLQINGPSPKHKKFRAKDSDYPVAPYPIRFSTAAEGGQPADPRVTTKNSTAFTKLRTAFLGAYSHRGRTGIDWPPHIDRAEKALLAARTPQAFATSAAALLKKAKDPHIWLTLDATGTVIGSFSPDTSPNIEPSTLKKYVPNIQKLAPTVLVGELPNRGPIYIALTSFSEAASDDIDKAIGHIRALDPTSPVILDIRLNSGGSEILARKIAALFTPAPAVYATHQNITATGFTAVQERTSTRIQMPTSTPAVSLSSWAKRMSPPPSPSSSCCAPFPAPSWSAPKPSAPPETQNPTRSATASPSTFPRGKPFSPTALNSKARGSHPTSKSTSKASTSREQTRSSKPPGTHSVPAEAGCPSACLSVYP